MLDRRVGRLTFASAAIVFALGACQPSAATSTLASATNAPETRKPLPATAMPTVAVATQRLPTAEPMQIPWVVPLGQTPIPVSKDADLPYSGKWLLDVYAPTMQGSWPVVVLLHGGGDTKEVMTDLAEAIAGHGAVVFAPSYYSLPTGEAWQSAGQVACAMRYAREQADRYGGDGARAMLVGYSGGGGFGALMLLAGDDFHSDCLTQEGSALPDAFVALDGAYDLLHFVSSEELRANPAEWRRISPFTYVDRQPLRTGVPILLLVGEFTDARQHAQAFRDALQSAGYEVWIESVPGADHMAMASPLPQIVRDIHDLLPQ